MASGMVAVHSEGDRPVQSAIASPNDALQALVDGAQQGDVRSFEALYERFYDKVFRYVLFKTGNVVESEDITEDVFLKMLESIGSFRWRGSPFSSWLFRIAHNLVIDYFRKKSRRMHVPLDDVTGLLGAASNDIDNRLDVKLSMAQVQRAMGELTKLQREVLSLRFAAGLSLLEVAQIMGKNKNSVKALQHAAIKKLRMVLGSCQEGLPGQTIVARGG